MKPPPEPTSLSEDFLRRVVASSPDCIKVLDLEGNLLSMNEGGQKVLEIADLTPHLGTCWTNWWKGGPYHHEACQAVEEARRGGTGRFEAFAATFGGTPMWWDVTVSPIPGTDGRPDKLLSVSRDITRRKLVEQQLAEERQHHVAALSQLAEQQRLALDSARMGWWRLEPARPELYCDERFRIIFGLREPVLSYAAILACIHPEDRAMVDAAVQAAVRPVNPVPYALEYRLLQEEGSVRWVTARGQAVFEGEGEKRRPVSLVGTVIDSTETRASESKYRSIFNSIDQGYCVIKVLFDEAGQPQDYLFLEVNPAFEQQTGLKNAVGRRIRELAPHHEAIWFSIYGRVATEGLPTRFEAEAASLGRWYDVYATSLGDPGEHHVAVAFTDITARRNSEEALRAERELLRTVFDQAPDDAILIMDAGRRLTAWNPAAERITGWTAAEAVGQTADLIFTPEDRAAGAAGEETRQAAQDGKATGERWHMRRDGKRFWSSGTVNALHDPEGGVRGYLKVFRDATARHLEAGNLAFLSQLADDLLVHPDSPQIIEIVQRRLGEHLQAARVMVTEASEDGAFVTVNRSWSLPGMKELSGTYRLADFGPTIAADYAAGRPHVRRNAEREYPPGVELENIRAVQALAAIDMPVRIEGRLRFVVVVHEAGPREWTEAEVALVRQVADRMVTEIERVRAEQALQMKEARSRFLADLGELIRQTPDPDAVLSVVVDRLREHLGADRCVYAEVEEDQDSFKIRYDRANPAGSNRSLIGRYQLSGFGQRMLPILRAARTVVVADVATDPQIADAREAMAAVGVGAVINVPLVKGGRLVAILAIHEMQPRRWTEDEVLLVEAVAERSWGEVVRSRDARALAESEARFRQLADAMPQIVWAAQPDGNIDYYNQRWYEYTGTPGGSVGRASWERVLHPDEIVWAERQWLQACATGTRLEMEVRYRQFGGEWRWHLVRGLPVRHAEGHIVRWFGTSTDIHESRVLREQNAALLESERAARGEAERTSHLKDEFLATLSHELRTPLNAILGWTHLLREGEADQEDLAQGLATIERNARAQTQIIEDLLDMSKIISGKVRLDMQRLDLASTLQGAVETMQPAAGARGIRLFSVLKTYPAPVTGDPNRLQQVFWNLLSNAIKFTPAGGEVQVLLEGSANQLDVSVKDSGEGIAPEFLPYVFDRFRQQDASTTRRHGGLGLGLAIVRQLVELHGGRVQVSSGGPGQGSTFAVTLPLAVLLPEAASTTHEVRPAAPAELPLSLAAQSWDLHGLKALVVDDEADARSLVKRLLEDRGATARTAGSAAEALQLLAAERPDVLISDIGMPDEDGYGLIRRIRALSAEQGGAIPAIALTAYARAEDRMKAILAGFQMHVSKPVEPAELLTMVASLTRRTQPG